MEDGVDIRFIIRDQTLIWKHYDKTTSTQDCAKEARFNIVPEDWVVYSASEQTGGRGTGTNSWSSSLGNLYLSYHFLCDNRQLYLLSRISQGALLAVMQLLDQNQIQSTFKWPNDALVDQKKIAGVLVETYNAPIQSHVIGFTAVIIGIGINVTTHPDNISQPSISMREKTGKDFNLNDLIYNLSDLLIRNVQYMLRGKLCFGTLHQKLERFKNNLLLFYSKPGQKYAGTIYDINNKGELVLQLYNPIRYLTFNHGSIKHGGAKRN